MIPNRRSPLLGSLLAAALLNLPDESERRMHMVLPQAMADQKRRDQKCQRRRNARKRKK